jgi:hypothetical protein
MVVGIRELHACGSGHGESVPNFAFAMSSAPILSFGTNTAASIVAEDGAKAGKAMPMVPGVFENRVLIYAIDVAVMGEAGSIDACLAGYGEDAARW